MLSVDIVRLQRIRLSHGPLDAVPFPVLRTVAGREVGKLPEGFPVDPPGRQKVRFVNPRWGFPHEVRLFQAGESAVSPQPLPSLRWDPAAGRYE